MHQLVQLHLFHPLHQSDQCIPLVQLDQLNLSVQYCLLDLTDQMFLYFLSHLSVQSDLTDLWIRSAQ